MITAHLPLPDGSGNGHVPRLARDEQLSPADEALLDIVANAFTSRMEWMKAQSDPRRNIDKECGFPDPGVINDQVIENLVDRDSLAAAVVERMPKACWQVSPLVYETDAADEVTDFERAWDDLGKNLRTEKSFHKQELGSVIWEYLCRADILSRRGRYGAILFGFNDTTDLSQPVEGMEEWFSQPSPFPTKDSDGTGELTRSDITPKPRKAGISGVFNYDQAQAHGLTANQTTDLDGFYDLTINKAKTKGRKLLYLRVFPETTAQIVSWETNDTSPRFGHPTMYQVTFNDPRSTNGGTIGGPVSQTRNVHWTRILPVADVHHTATDSEVLAVPAIEPVLNIILSAKKVWAGGSEGFWQGCFPTTYYETLPAVAGNVKINKQSLQEMAYKIRNGTQREGILDGVTAKTVAPSVVDFTPFMDSLINLICIKLEMPVRIFMGSERGELASTQDDAAWNDRVKQRQVGYVTPRIIVPFVDRLVNAGVLPEPKAKPKPKVEEGAKDAFPVLKTGLPTPAAPPTAPPAGPAGSKVAKAGGGVPQAVTVKSSPVGNTEYARDDLGRFASGTGSGHITDKTGQVWPVVHVADQGNDGHVRHTYTVKTPGTEKEMYGDVAKVVMDRKAKSVMWVSVNQEHQRKGIASELYKHIEGHLGKPIEENWATTPEGEAFWKGRRAKGHAPTTNVAFPPPKPASTADSQPASAGGDSKASEAPGVPTKAGPPNPQEVVGSKAKTLMDESPGYCVEWPDITSQSAEEKATVAGGIATALDTYTKGGASTIIPPMEFLTKVLNWTEEEAIACLESAVEHQEITQQKEMDKQQTMIDQGLAPDPTKPVEAPPGAPGAAATPKPTIPRTPPVVNEWDDEDDYEYTWNTDQPRDDLGRFAHTDHEHIHKALRELADYSQRVNVAVIAEHLGWDHGKTREVLKDMHKAGSVSRRKKGWGHRGDIVYDTHPKHGLTENESWYMDDATITDNAAGILIGELSKYLYGLVSDVTMEDAKNIARAVKQGVTKDYSDTQVANRLKKVLPEEYFNDYRVKLIARTEMSRAKAELLVGNMSEGETVKFTSHAECCDHCQTLNGKVYTAAAASGVIPVHPACRCHWDKGADPLTGNMAPNQPRDDDGKWVGVAGLRKAYATVVQRKLATGGLVKVPELIDEMKKSQPGLTDDKAHEMLKKWAYDDHLTLQVDSEAHILEGGKESKGRGIKSPRGYLNFVQINEDHYDEHGKTGKKPTANEVKHAPAGSSIGGQFVSFHGGNATGSGVTSAHLEQGKRETIKPGVDKVDTERGTFAVKQRDTADKGATAEHQVSQMAKVAGVNVPGTEKMTVHGKPAVVTEWAHGKPLNEMDAKERTNFLKKVPKDQIDKHVLFDYLIGHGDTHNGNFIAGKDGNLHGIDKELWGHNGGHGTGTKFDIPHFLSDLHGGYDTMHPFDRKNLEHMIEAGPKMAAVPGLDPKDAKGIMNRVQVLKELAKKPDAELTAGNLWGHGLKGAPRSGIWGKIKGALGG